MNGNVMATRTAVMALTKPIVTNHVQTTSLLAKISSVSATLGAVMGMMIAAITPMKISVKLLLVHQVDTGQCAYAIRMNTYWRVDMHAHGFISLKQSPLESSGSSAVKKLIHPRWTLTILIARYYFHTCGWRSSWLSVSGARIISASLLWIFVMV